MREILNSFLDNSKERIKNPFLGAFIISWVAFNWKPVIILFFSEKEVEQKISFINQNYLSIKYNLWLPLIFAILYVVLLPYIMLLFDRVSSKALEGRKENIVQQNIFDIKAKQRLAEEESILENIRAKFRDKADLNKKIEFLTDQLEEFRITNENLEQKLKVSQDKELQYKEIIEQNNSVEYTAKEKFQLAENYENFRNSDLFQFFRDIGTSVSRMNTVPNKMDNLIIEKFKHSDIIREVKDEENQRNYYEFTKKGKFFWKEYIMHIKITLKNKEEEDNDDLPF
jgi:hypothetical protein